MVPTIPGLSQPLLEPWFLTRKNVLQDLLNSLGYREGCGKTTDGPSVKSLPLHDTCKWPQGLGLKALYLCRNLIIRLLSSPYSSPVFVVWVSPRSKAAVWQMFSVKVFQKNFLNYVLHKGRHNFKKKIRKLRKRCRQEMCIHKIHPVRTDNLVRVRWQIDCIYFLRMMQLKIKIHLDTFDNFPVQVWEFPLICLLMWILEKSFQKYRFCASTSPLSQNTWQTVHFKTFCNFCVRPGLRIIVFLKSPVIYQAP